ARADRVRAEGAIEEVLEPPGAARAARARGAEKRARTVGRVLRGIPALRAGDRRQVREPQRVAGGTARAVVHGPEDRPLLPGLPGHRRARMETAARRLRARRGARPGEAGRS